MRPATFGDIIWAVGMVIILTSHSVYGEVFGFVYAMFGVWLNYKFPVK